MGDVVALPIKGTKIKKWFDDAALVVDSINEPSAQAWVRKNVPPQFHRLINSNIRAYAKQKGEKDIA